MTTVRYMCVDPGFQNLCAIRLKISGTKDIFEVSFNAVKMFDVRGARGVLDEVKLQAAIEEIAELAVDANMCLVEYQRFSANTNLSYIEGAVKHALKTTKAKCTSVHPGAAKRFHGVATRNYAKNKLAAIEKAKTFCAGVNTDHAADCVLMAIYHWCKVQHK